MLNKYMSLTNSKKMQFLILFSVFLINFNLIQAQEKSITPLLGKNTIINGGAEAGEAAWRGEGFESARYGSFGDEWDVGVAGAPNGGDSYFRLTVNENKESSSSKQLIDLSPLGELLDKTPLEVTLSGYIGGIPSKEEKFATITLSASFLDMDKKLLSSFNIEVKETELPKPEIGEASIILKNKTEKFPKGARFIEVVLKVKNACSSCTSIAYADNLSLIFKQTK